MAFFWQEFPLVEALQNFRKRALMVSLANLTYLGFTGTLGAMVCSKIFCLNATLRKS